MTTITITLPVGYQPPTSADIARAKKWTLLRNDNANHLAALVAALLEDAAEKLTKIGYKYNCKPADFQFSRDKKLREEVAQMMADLEEEILLLIEEYALNESNDEKRHALLLPWLLALKSKGAKDLQSTLHNRLTQFLYDTEAQIAAMRMAGHGQTKAISRIKSTLHSVYTTPEVQSAYRKNGASLYLQSRGVHYGNYGQSSSGANNVENFARQTAQLAWMKSQLLNFQATNAVGYYQLRGSSYPCAICDDEVGFHLGLPDEVEYPHARCMCYRVPVYEIPRQDAPTPQIL